MSSRRPVEAIAKRLLREGWEVCSTPAGACASPNTVDSADRLWIPTEVPATAASVLSAAGLWSLDGAERRFDAEDWWFRTRFDLPEGAPDVPIELGFEGLATLCEVWLNGEPILQSDNMFLAHAVSTRGLRTAGNELALVFRSLDAALKARRPRPRWRAPMIENQQLRWYRTTLLGRTPGWSPPAAAVGPWRPVWVGSAQSTVRVDRLQTRLHGSQGHLQAQGSLPRNLALHSGQLFLQREDEVLASVPVDINEGRFHADLDIDAVEPWWPHTHGKASRYLARLRCVDTKGAIHEWPLGHVGFRSLTIDTDGGQGFALRVNEVSVFCRGACWTPLDIVSLRADLRQYREALLQVRDAGFNMLRLSGALIYEEGCFFDLCDELGILVWQDFMFANMDYPAGDEKFIDSVRAEAVQKLREWGRHPSVAVICGNSEVSQQAAMWGAPRECWSPELFASGLRDLAGEHCPGTPYWPSSASGGDLPFQVNVGTTSYYGVGAYLRPIDDARRSGLRFATESLAFANIPEPDTLDMLPGGGAIKVHHPQWKRRVPRDLGAGWDFDDVRDFYLKYLFDVDPLELRYADHARYLEMSRRVPAEIMTAAFTEWRRAGSRCGGAVIWLLRDLWPGAGWGVIDSAGLPKAPWYALRRALQPRWLSITDEGLNGLALHAGNETETPFQGAVELALYRSGQHLITRATHLVAIAPRTTLELNAAGLLGEFHDLTHSYRFGALSCDLVVATLNDGQGSVVAQVFHLTHPSLHATRLASGLLTARARKLETPGHYALVLHSSRFARSVHIDAPGYIAEDQYFHMAPGAEVVLQLRARDFAAPGLLGTVAALNSSSPTRIEISS